MVSAIVVVGHWQANEAAELLMDRARCDLYGEEIAVVGRPVECADMVTAEGVCGQVVVNAPGGTVAAAMGLGIPSVIL